MSADPHLHPLRHRIRALVSWLHLWLGLTVGTIFAVLGLSGSVLTFHSELLLAQHPQIAAHKPVVDGAVLARLMETWAPQGMRSIDVPRASMPVWQGFFADDSRRYFASDTGEVLLVRNVDSDWLLWLHELHTHLLAGETGKEVVGIAGWIACFMLISGLYLWWPRLGRWLAQLRTYANPPVRRWLTWHRSAGAITLPLLLLVAICGVGMIYHKGARALLTGVFGGATTPPDPPRLATATEVPDWSQVLTIARAGLPQARLSRIAVPRDGDSIINIRAQMPGEWHPNGRSLIFVDANSDTVPVRYDASTQPAGSRAADAIYPLHIGAVGGLPYRIAVTLAGVLPSFLLVTGLLFWWRRRAARRGARVRSVP